MKQLISRIKTAFFTGAIGALFFISIFLLFIGIPTYTGIGQTTVLKLGTQSGPVTPLLLVHCKNGEPALDALAIKYSDGYVEDERGVVAHIVMTDDWSPASGFARGYILFGDAGRIKPGQRVYSGFSRALRKTPDAGILFPGGINNLPLRISLPR